MKTTAYITTSIAYANGQPHIGHALELVQADFFARAIKQQGVDVRLLTGTDEHGLKVQQAAERQGVTPQEFVNQHSSVFQTLADLLSVSYARFIRTSDQDHQALAQAFWRICQKNGDIYKRHYRAWYDIKEETFLGLVDEYPDPTVFNVEPRFIEMIDEENYFFRLSRYKDQIISLLSSAELKITPLSRAKELLNFITDKGMEDISISRDALKLSWGVPVPDDEQQVMYVWFDALTNYLTACSSIDGTGKILPDIFWPPTLHCVGKDIHRFHSMIWPAMLLSAGLPLPEEVLVHGFIVAEDGRKMSKSIGNVIDPIPLIERFGSDAVRWFLLKEMHTTDDSRLKVERISEVYSADLANTLGNLVNRLSAMAKQYCSGSVTIEPSEEMRALCTATTVDYGQAVKARNTQAALQLAFNLAAFSNRSIEEYKPWQVAKLPERSKELRQQLGSWFYCLQTVVHLLTPAMPVTADKLSWLAKRSGEIVIPQEVPILFPRL